MKKLILIKYGELSTKKGNINYFIKTLENNIKNKLKNYDVTINDDKSRMFITTESNYDEIIEILKKIFGIHEIMVGYELDTNNIDEIGVELNKLLQDKSFTTFKIITKRSDKRIPETSMDISRKLGGIVLKNNECSVDVHHPELEINVELRMNHTYLYFEKIEGIKGYPSGTLGKGLLMLSGGIDSPVAGYMAMKRGMNLDAIYFEAPPHTSINARNKVLSLAKIISEYGNNIRVHVINFTEIEESIYKNIPKEYLITIMRRMMYRIATIVASKYRAHVIVNGESIGQVASQTLTSMKAINEVTNIPVIRPVCCFDKLEIIDIAKRIGTYETSILPYEDCCTIFVPDHPIINPDLKTCEEYEKLIDYQNMIYKCIKEHEIIDLNKMNKYDDIL